MSLKTLADKRTKTVLSYEECLHYRPVSNLLFASKLVERVAAKQLNAHLNDNAPRDPFQSAYRADHSTETAFISVKNDIAGALDRKCTTILVLLDLSCASDTINHELLLRRRTIDTFVRETITDITELIGQSAQYAE